MDVISAAVRVLVMVATVMAAACFAPAQPSTQPLLNTFDSPEALGRAVLDRLERRDLEGLRSLPLSEPEFRSIWPELPVSRPERNVPFDYVWGEMKQRSDGYLRATFRRYGGRPLKFVRTRFSGEATQYQSFTVMRDSEIVAADHTGRELILRLYGAALVRDRRYKLFSYVVDD